MTDTNPPARRRWYQFSMGTLLLLITLVAVSVFGVREHIQREQLRLRMLVLEAELRVTQDARLHKMQEQLDDVERTLDERGRQIVNKNDVTLKRYEKQRDTLEAKIAARRDKLLKVPTQGTP
jgi:hypothetical protein